MKYHLVLLATEVFLLSGISNISLANRTIIDEKFLLMEYSANAPDVPGLPEDDILYGDANNDGEVNVLDIITIVNFIMGGNPDPFNFEAADTNNDGVIDVLDIIFEVSVIMEVPDTPCAGMPAVAYEGQIYNTVKIGYQCWLKENLNVGTMINSIQGGYLQTDNGIIEKYCSDNSTVYCDTYGGLYEWPEAMQYATEEGVQGICPFGWHIPTDGEIKILEGSTDSQYPVDDPEWDETGWRGNDVGGNLKEACTNHWYSPNTGATNASGFTALPGGYRTYQNGTFGGYTFFGILWSSTQSSTENAWFRELYYNYSNMSRYSGSKVSGYSVRCLKGCWPQPAQANAGPDQENMPGTFTTLAGNSPTYGTGVWHIISGTGGFVADTTNPISTFTGLAGNTYSLTWMIITQCGSTEDTVQISFAAGFNCGGTLVDNRDGHSYTTVLIGAQCWMAENLKVGMMITSSQGGYQQQDNGTIEKYCYNNDDANCDVYGGLYEWPEAMQYVTTEGAQGICPAGWHLPTDGEWTALSDYLGGFVAGGKMKTTGTIEEGTGLWDAPNYGATNESGFSGLPGGHRYYYDGNFLYLGKFGLFWSSSQYTTSSAWTRNLRFDSVEMYRFNNNKDYGYSVRCLKDD